VRIDGTVNEVAGVDITGFPVIRFYGKDKASSVAYDGGYGAGEIVEWLKKHTQY